MQLPTKEEMRRALAGRIGQQMLEKLSGTTVAVCGLGGLGSHIAGALARAGVGRLILIDFDRVDLSNLNRQQYRTGQIGLPKALALAENLREFAPYADLVPVVERVTEENLTALLAGADIICEAFDSAVEKSMLVNAVLEKLPDRYLVAASGMAGLGPANGIITRRITDHFYLCGDGVSEAVDGMGLWSSRVMLCAAHQAHAVLRIIAGELDV